MVGRDIGTVVLPEAHLKIYLDASVEERARRRQREMQARGEYAEFDRVRAGLIRRDQIDSERATAPLRPAEGAIIVDSTYLDVASVMRVVKNLVDERDP
jgi:cytidylate kinase